ncbi:ISAs1 family transposase [Streptomyces sp. NBC_00452]|uniref:ISAs1 family transposase n=1 Tax=Streptomyces sp. NBC_00452 TaxID=2975746 RepID=UPI0022500AFA|nr:ISAs1 family transposase [Streptomyces sp. NBC_00452]MCX5061398.1 ISAs1 family transposase [Streptomyces sp. NBC_00452]
MRRLGGGTHLVDRLVLLPDPRGRRGRRHSLVSVLLVAASAVLAGARSFRAIGQWAAAAPQHTLDRLGARAVSAFGVCLAPSTSTIRRVVGTVCPGGLADLTGADPAGTDTLAVDGKTVRGSRRGDTPAAHLLAAVTATGRTVTQVRVPDKTNEITCFAALLAQFDLEGVVVTADALHTQRAHARFLVEEKKAHYLLVVKANQPALHRTLRSLPWTQVTARHYQRGSGHGRRETRVTRTLTVTDLGLDFPYAVQASKITRYRTDLRTGLRTRQTVYALTDMTHQQASPQRTGELARSQWTIENRLHFVRDPAFAEDASKIRTGHGPANMATLRNLAINTLRDHGHTSIAAGLRHVSYEPFTRPLDLLSIP